MKKSVKTMKPELRASYFDIVDKGIRHITMCVGHNVRVHVETDPAPKKRAKKAKRAR